MTHFVYVYSAMTPIWEELKFSCMSILKYYQGKYKIYIVGDKPPFRGPYTFIPHIAIHHKLHAKAFDSVSKLRLITERSDINDEFVYMYDDQVFLKDFWYSFINQPIAHDEVIGDPGEYFGKSGRIPSPRWKKLFYTTFNALRSHGLPTWNYETHAPKIFRKKEILEVIEKFRPDRVPMLFNSLYTNYVYEKPYCTLKDKPDFIIGIHNPRPIEWLDKHIKEQLLLNFDDVGLNKHLKVVIKEKVGRNVKIPRR